MFNRIIHHQPVSLHFRIEAFNDYLRHLDEAAQTVSFRLPGFTPAATHRDKTRRYLPLVARFPARLHAFRGESLQFVIDQSVREGSVVGIVRWLSCDDPLQFERIIRRAVEFVFGVLYNTFAQERPRKERAGDQRPVDLSLAMAAFRVIPSHKRGIGYPGR